MAVDKLVDSTQLDSDLTSVANAIRTKGGTSASLAFPADFVSAINAISGGGGDIDALIDNTIQTVTSNVTSIRNSAFRSCTSIVSASFPLCITINSQAFQGANKLETLSIPICTTLKSDALRDCTKLTSLIAPEILTIENMAFRGVKLPILVFNKATTSGSSAFESNTDLTTVDMSLMGAISNYAFNGCTSFSILILRKTGAITTLANVNAFQNTPFASGGAGGTLYVPSSLKSTYENASNWATILGYANNSIATIEGSTYETHYADGTAI